MSIESIQPVVKNNIQLVGDNVPQEGPLVSKEKESSQKEDKPDLSRMREVVMNLQKNLKVFHNVNLNFSVHKASGQIMITVTEEDTGKVIREIPPEEVLDLTAKLEEMIGIIFDKKI